MSSLTEQIREARMFHRIADVLGSDKKLLVCPLPTHVHHNNTPSFSVYTRNGYEWWNCHGSCHLDGDIVDLMGYLRIPGYDPKNHRMLRDALALLDSRYEKVIPALPEKEAALDGREWRDFLPTGIEVIEYARGRGLTLETLEKFRVGQKGLWMTMPTFQEGRLVGIKLRNTRPNPQLRYYNLKGTRKGLFNYDAVNLTLQPVLIVKAEIPCMLLDQLGFLACAPNAGEGCWRESWRVSLALARRIVVGDNDPPGRALGEKRAKLFNADLVFPPDPYKDIDEYLLADRDRAVETVQGWLNQ